MRYITLVVVAVVVVVKIVVVAVVVVVPFGSFTGTRIFENFFSSMNTDKRYDSLIPVGAPTQKTWFVNRNK